MFSVPNLFIFSGGVTASPFCLFLNCNTCYLLLTLLELLWMESSGAACRVIFKSLQWEKFESVAFAAPFVFDSSSLCCILTEVQSLWHWEVCERPKCLVQTVTQMCSHLTLQRLCCILEPSVHCSGVSSDLEDVHGHSAKYRLSQPLKTAWIPV